LSRSNASFSARCVLALFSRLLIKGREQKLSLKLLWKKRNEEESGQASGRFPPEQRAERERVKEKSEP